MKNKSTVRLLICACLILVLSLTAFFAACAEPEPTPTPTPTPAPAPAPSPAPEPVKVTKLVAANYLPPDNPVVETLETWGKDLGERTGGQYTLEVISGGALVAMTDSYDALVGGICDVAFYPPPMIEKPFPVASLPSLYWGGVSAELMSKAWYNNVYKKGYLDAEHTDIKILMTFVGTPGDIETINAVNTLADLKGVKLANAQGQACVNLADALGAISVLAGPPDSYVMLEKGIVDGIFISALAIKEFHCDEFLNYALPIQVSHMSHIVGLNLDVYNKMSDDVKKIVDEMAENEKYSLMTPPGHDAMYEDSLKYFFDGGGEKIEWSAADMTKMNETVAPLWDEELDKLEGQGAPAREVCDELYNAMLALGAIPDEICIGYTPGG